MSEKSRGLLFRKRNVLGAALIAGIGLGVFLGKLGLFPGLGKPGVGGGNDGGSSAVSTVASGMNDASSANDESGTNDDEINGGESLATPSDVIRVVIDERRYLLREKAKETPISLADLINRIKNARGDEEHFKVRIFRKMTARAAAVEALTRELSLANIPDSAVLWVPPSEHQWDDNSSAKAP